MCFQQVLSILGLSLIPSSTGGAMVERSIRTLVHNRVLARPLKMVLSFMLWGDWQMYMIYHVHLQVYRKEKSKMKTHFGHNQALLAQPLKITHRSRTPTNTNYM